MGQSDKHANELLKKKMNEMNHQDSVVSYRNKQIIKEKVDKIKHR